MIALRGCARRRRAHCEGACEPDYVDTDGLRVTGCECELQSGPGVVIGADADCDGVVDPTPEYVFVAPSGDDANDGGDVGRARCARFRRDSSAARRSAAACWSRAASTAARRLRDGVSLLGGYSPDFRAHDPSLYPVLIEADPARPGRAGAALATTSPARRRSTA